MPIRKIIGAVLSTVGSGLLIWGVILPQFDNKVANDSIESISQVNHPVSSTPPTTQPATPAATPVLTTLQTGTFQSLRGQQAKGTVNILKNGSGVVFVRLEEDFSVSNGPDLYVGFGNEGRVDESSLVSLIKANKGSQNFELPSTLDSSKYTQVFIYCKAFAYPFGVANLL